VYSIGSVNYRFKVLFVSVNTVYVDVTSINSSGTKLLLPTGLTIWEVKQGTF